MGFIDQFSSMHLDILKEIGNIGAGHAATALSELLNKKIEMNVPNVRIVSFDEMIDIAGGSESIAACVFLRIEGEAGGNMFFVLPLSQATHYIRLMTGNADFSLTNPPYDEMALSALQELGNILSGSYLTALADFTQLSLYPTVPAVVIDMVGAIISFGLMEYSRVSDQCIVIDTALKEEGAASVRGHFFLFPDPDTFKTIFSALGVSRND